MASDRATSSHTDLQQHRSRHALAIDIGGTKVLIAIVTPDGQILARTTMPTRVPGQTPAKQMLAPTASVVAEGWPGVVSHGANPAVHLVERIASAATTLCATHAVMPSGVGVATTGHVDSASGVVLHSGLVPGWSGFPLARRLAEALAGMGLPSLPVTIDNDGHAMALAEGRLGAARGIGHALCVAVGTGVGGGWLVDGNLYRGQRGLAGLVGHSVIEYRGRRCQCGKQGCLEAYAAGPRIVDEYRRLMRRKGSGKDDPGSTARQQLVISEGLANRDLTLQSLCARADAGDEIAHDAIVRGGAYLGVGLASLANVMNPGVIVVGGGVLGAGTRWFDAVRRTVLERVRHTIAAGLDVVPAELGSDAVVIGAGLMALG